MITEEDGWEYKVQHEYKKKSEHDQALNFLKNIPDVWNNEPLITGISLENLKKDEICINPAFTRDWPGTVDYSITVKVDDDAENNGRRLQ